MGIKLRHLIFFFSFITLLFSSSTIAFAGNPPDAANSSLTATEVPANGTTTSTITVTLKDSTGTALAGDSVQLVNTSDSTIKILPVTAVLDATGSATFTATSTTAGTDPIDVTDTTTTTTLTALGNVIFDPVATPTPTTGIIATPTPVTPVTGPTDLPYFGFAAVLLSIGGLGIFFKSK